MSMARSRFFQELCDNISRLEAKFISEQYRQETEDIASFSPDLEFLAAYRMLAHAEIEDYLERKARDRVTLLKASVSGPSGFPALSSCGWVYQLAALFKVDLVFEVPFDAVRFFDKVSDVLQEAEDKINKNNGIKSETLKYFSLILGKDIDEVDQVLAAALSSYGAGRGDVAHKSLRRTNVLNAPSVEKKAVDDLVRNLGIYFHELEA